jgi:hypothetical protein
MIKKKDKKELYKEALSRVKKELAEPRMANSVREQEVRNARGPVQARWLDRSDGKSAPHR